MQYDYYHHHFCFHSYVNKSQEKVTNAQTHTVITVPETFRFSFILVYHKLHAHFFTVVQLWHTQAALLAVKSLFRHFSKRQTLRRQSQQEKN